MTIRAAETAPASQHQRMPDEGTVLLVDPNDVIVGPQGRGRSGGGDMSPEGVSDLVSSIERIGQIQPCVVIATPEGKYRLLVGERRLRAFLFGNRNGRPWADKLKVLVVDEPSQAAVRQLQLAENVARTDLSDGDLAQGLLFARCALTKDALTAAGVAAAQELDLADEPDPIRLWRQVERVRRSAGLPVVSWEDVIADLGLGVSPSKANAVVSAFRRLPADITAQLDEAGVSTAARKHIARWWRHASGYHEAGMGIEEAVAVAERDIGGTPTAEPDPDPEPAFPSTPEPGWPDTPATGHPAGATFPTVPAGFGDNGFGDNLSDTEFQPPPLAGIAPTALYLSDEPEPVAHPASRTPACPPHLVDQLLHACRAVTSAGGPIGTHPAASLQHLFSQIATQQFPTS